MSPKSKQPPQQQRRRRPQHDPLQRPREGGATGATSKSSSACSISLVAVQCVIILMFCSYFATNTFLSSLVLPETTTGGKGSSASNGKQPGRSFLGRGMRPFGRSSLARHDSAARERGVAGILDITKAVKGYERALQKVEAEKKYQPDPGVPLEPAERANKEGENPLILRAKTNRPEVQSGEREIVAILVATRSDPKWESASNTALQRFLLPSLQKNVTEEEISAFDIRLHVAMDDDDTFWLKQKNWLDLYIPAYLKVYVHTFPNTDNRIPFNELAKAALDDGATYFCRINDDTAFASTPWIELATSTLKQDFDPPNVGVVGPTCKEGNKAILTHDFVHKTHLEIFGGLYYPSQFHNWYLDDWITNIYGSKVLGDDFHRSVKLPDWIVTHHLQTPRYKSNENDAKFLPTLYDQGLEQIRNYVKEHFPDIAPLLKKKAAVRDKDGMPENAQIGKEQVQAILDVLPEDGGNMLVWGLGNDSPYWHRVTNGNAVFIEDDFKSEKDGTQWFTFVMENYPYLKAHKVSYTTQLTPSWERYHEHEERWNDELKIKNFPEGLWALDWDVILVDAPLGCCGMGPGRYQSLYTTFLLVQKLLKKNPKKTIHVFVDDYERPVERDFSREVFGREPIKVVTRPPGASNSNEQAHFVFGGSTKAVKPKKLKSKLSKSTLSSSFFSRLFSSKKLDLVKDKEAFELKPEEEKPKVKEKVVGDPEAKPKPSRLGGGLIANAVRSQLKNRAKEPTPWTIVVTVNDGYYDFMLNWLLHYDKLGLKDNRLVVIAEDDIVYGKLQDLGLPPEVMEVAKTKTVLDLQEALAYESEEYISMVSTRATYLLKFLRDQGQNVLYSDVDTVWRSNPLPYLDLPVYRSYDMILQIDDDKYHGVSPYYCTGFMALRSSPRTIKVLEEWEKKLKDKAQLNQPIFNRILHLSRAKHFGLPQHRFPSGKKYFDVWGDEQRMEAVVVHNNFIKGHDAKKDRFRKHDLWHDAIV